MANARVVQADVKIVLELTEGEAKHLKALFQNPLCDNEPTDLSELRRVVWNALNHAGVQSY